MSNDTALKIYLAVVPQNDRRNLSSYLGFALAEDGTLLSNPTAASAEECKALLEQQADLYRSHYPDGYILTWIDHPLTNPEWQRARERNLTKRP